MIFSSLSFLFFFFFNDTATTEIYTLSLHDALPICSVALRAPPAVGANATFTVHVPPAATGAARQVLAVIVKSVPAIERLLIVSGALPVFWTVTVCEADTVFTFWLANVSPVAAEGAVVTAGAVAAVPLTSTSANWSCSMFQSVSIPSPVLPAVL